MSPVVHLPLALRPEAGGLAAVEVACVSVSEALAELSARHPSMYRHLFDETGALRRHVNLFLNDDQLLVPEGTFATVAPGDQIHIVPSIAGGQDDGGSPSESATAASATRAHGGMDYARYGRQITLPELGMEGQQRLARARVLVVGAGGLGSPAALYLVAAGVGTVGIVDFDDVDVTNLHRQILYADADVGRPKIEAAVERLRAANPNVHVVAHETRLDSTNALDVIANYDFVIDGSDNFPTRYLINDACVLLGKPYAYGAILRFEGQASLFAAPGGPCYRCLFREPPPPGLVPSCAEAGVIGVLPGVIGSLQALEAIKWVTGAGTSLAGRLLIFDALDLRWRELRLKRDPECPACGDSPSIDRLIDYDEFCGLKSETGAADERNEISPVQLKAELDAERVILLDVREPYELSIASFRPYPVVHIPLGDLPARVGELDPANAIIVACRSGSRSAHAARWLRDAGYAQARNLAGGINAWSEQIDPTVPRY